VVGSDDDIDALLTMVPEMPDRDDVSASKRFITDSEVMIWSAVRSSHISSEDRETLEAALATLDAIIGPSKDSDAGYLALLSTMKIVNAMGVRSRGFEDSTIQRYSHHARSSRGGANKKEPTWLTAARPHITEYISRHPKCKNADIRRYIQKKFPRVTLKDRTIEGTVAKLRKKFMDM
jgi:hypothetical protein